MEFESYVANEGTRALAVCVQLSGEIGRNVSVILSSTDLSAQGYRQSVPLQFTEW